MLVDFAPRTEGLFEVRDDLAPRADALRSTSRLVGLLSLLEDGR
jgi:hypothetical protein